MFTTVQRMTCIEYVLTMRGTRSHDFG